MTRVLRPSTPANPDFAETVRACFARQGLMRTLGASLGAIEPGRVTVEMPVGPALTQQPGLAHGGAIGAIAEAAGACAALSRLPEAFEVTTVVYKINFVRPAIGSHLRACASVVRAGRTVSSVRVEVESGEGDRFSACAILQATFLAVAPSDAIASARIE